MIDITLDLEGFDEIVRRLAPNRIPEATTAMVTGLARLLLRYSQIDAPVRTGNLRRAGFMQVEDDGQSAIVAFGSHYAGVVEGGSVAHEIDAKNYKTLRFIPTSFSSLADATAASSASRATGTPKSGRVAAALQIFPTHVFHPGTIANPFMQSAWTDMGPDAEAWVNQVGQRWAAGDEQETA